MLDLDGLYAAIEDDDALARLADTVASACGTRSAMINHFGTDGAPLLSQINHYPIEPIQLYFNGFANHDPWLDAIIRAGSLGRPTCVDALLPPEQFMQTAMYNEVFRPMGDDTGRCMAILPKPGGETLIIGVQRAARDAAFTDEDAARLDGIYGHVKTVLRLRRLLDRERVEVRTLGHMIDASERAMVLVDRSLRIRRVSAAATSIFDQRDGIAFQANRLVIDDQVARRQIRAAIAATIDRNPVGNAAFLCRRPSLRRPYHLHVLPSVGPGTNDALLVVTDPEPRQAERSQSWAKAFALTAAEAAVAEGLVSGLAPRAIADQRQVTLETVRTQLQALFTKTQTGRQSELVALITRLMR